MAVASGPNDLVLAGPVFDALAFKTVYALINNQVKIIDHLSTVVQYKTAIIQSTEI